MFNRAIICKSSSRKKALNIVKMHQNSKNHTRIPLSEESKGKINQRLSDTAQQHNINSGIQQSGTPS
jgi:hypothetical protein